MTKRKMKGTGWVDYKKHPRGPNGRGLCRMCGEEVPKGRRTFCGEDCVHQYRLRNDARYASNQLRGKYKTVCALCGVDTKKEKQKFEKELKQCPDGLSYKERIEFRRGIEEKWAKAGWSPVYGKWYHVDHIIPVAEGGGPQDYPRSKDYLTNLRILCLPCHKAETRELRKRLRKKKNAK
jgi:5-methylcytosine-specific restriction enzyme A